MRYRRRKDEGGFALLFVFALAAAALVMLYLEMPRVAFEHQRDREALLVDRGEEYIRAIQLYVQKFNKYPQSLEELESTNNMRFLRKRFRDPMTGSDEWRLIHIDAAGQYIDSLVHKRQEPKKESGPHVLQSAVQGIGVSAEVVVPAGEGQAQSPALRRTASDRIIPGMPGQEGGRGEPQEGEPPPREESPREEPPPPPEAPAPPQPGTGTVIQGEPGSSAGAASQNPFRMPGNVPPQQAGQPGSPAQPPSIGQPSIGYGGGIGPAPAPPPAPPPPATGSGAAAAPWPSPGAPGLGSGAGMQRPGVPNEALQAIQRVLTRQPAQAGLGTGGMAIGGGIAGVASKADMEGIRLYNNATNYKEWEFLFDFRKAMQAAGMGAALGQGQTGAPGQPSGQQTGPFERPGRSSSSGFGFGGSASQGGRSSFGSGIGGFGGQPQPAPPPRP